MVFGPIKQGSSVTSGRGDVDGGVVDTGSLANGDLEVVVAYVRDSSAVTLTMNDSSWTSVLSENGSGGNIAVFYRLYDSSTNTDDAAINITGNDEGSPYFVAGFSRSGVAALDQSNSVSFNSTQQDIGPITGLTTSNAKDSWTILVGGKRDNWTRAYSASGGGLTWLSHVDVSDTTADDGAMTVQSADDTGGGSVISAITLTVEGGASESGAGVLFSLTGTENLSEITDIGRIENPTTVFSPGVSFVVTVDPGLLDNPTSVLAPSLSEIANNEIQPTGIISFTPTIPVPTVTGLGRIELPSPLANPTYVWPPEQAVALPPDIAPASFPGPSTTILEVSVSGGSEPNPTTVTARRYKVQSKRDPRYQKSLPSEVSSDLSARLLARDRNRFALSSPNVGDMLYYDGSEWVSIPAGADGEVLTLVSGIPKWA